MGIGTLRNIRGYIVIAFGRANGSYFSESWLTKSIDPIIHFILPIPIPILRPQACSIPVLSISPTNPPTPLRPLDGTRPTRTHTLYLCRSARRKIPVGHVRIRYREQHSIGAI